MPQTMLEFWEFLSYVVTVLGFPAAIYTLWREMRAERENEAKEIEQREDEIYVSLSQQYTAFLEAALANPELDLLGDGGSGGLSAQQITKKQVYYEMLIALFERAYILLYEPNLSGNSLRRWASWADYITVWLKKLDFRAYALANLDGEDADFAAFVRARATEG